MKKKCQGQAFTSLRPFSARAGMMGAYMWLGVRKQTGRGEGSSGLAFDQIVHVDQAKTG